METVYMRVEQLWSYNLFGGLKELLEHNSAMSLDQRVVNDVLEMTADYIRNTFNFHLVGKPKAQAYNLFLAALEMRLNNYPVDPAFFTWAFSSLYRMLHTGLHTLNHPISQVTSICSPLGELEGFVFNIKTI